MNQTFGRSEAVAKLVETVHFRYTTGSPPHPSTTPSQPPSQPRPQASIPWSLDQENGNFGACAPDPRKPSKATVARLFGRRSLGNRLPHTACGPSAAGGLDRLAPMRPRRGPIRQLVANPSSFGERRCWAGSGPTPGGLGPVRKPASFSRCCCTRGRSVRALRHAPLRPSQPDKELRSPCLRSMPLTHRPRAHLVDGG